MTYKFEVDQEVFVKYNGRRQKGRKVMNRREGRGMWDEPHYLLPTGLPKMPFSWVPEYLLVGSHGDLTDEYQCYL
jgi:hypothetical protein